MQYYEEITYIDLSILSKDWIEEIYEYFSKSIKENFSKTSFYKTGSTRINKASSELKIKLHFYYFINDINEIFKNFSLIISDLNTLKNHPHYFQGSPYKRFYLILRTFFYEFYRIKENHKKFLIYLEKEKHIEKDKIKNINELFHLLFQETLILRNKLVHHSVIWTEDHTELVSLYIAEETGHKLFNKDTGEKVTWETILPELCDYYCNTLIEQSKRTKEYLELLIEELLDSIKLKTA